MDINWTSEMDLIVKELLYYIPDKMKKFEKERIGVTLSALNNDEHRKNILNDNNSEDSSYEVSVNSGVITITRIPETTSNEYINDCIEETSIMTQQMLQDDIQFEIENSLEIKDLLVEQIQKQIMNIIGGDS